jgi:hypothetical protein
VACSEKRPQSSNFFARGTIQLYDQKCFLAVCDRFHIAGLLRKFFCKKCLGLHGFNLERRRWSVVSPFFVELFLSVSIDNYQWSAATYSPWRQSYAHSQYSFADGAVVLGHIFLMLPFHVIPSFSSLPHRCNQVEWDGAKSRSKGKILNIFQARFIILVRLISAPSPSTRSVADWWLRPYPHPGMEPIGITPLLSVNLCR